MTPKSHEQVMTTKPNEQVIERLEERLTQTSSNAAHARIELDAF